MLKHRLIAGSLMAAAAGGVLVGDSYLAPYYPFLFGLALLAGFLATHELVGLLPVPTRPPLVLCAAGVVAMLAACAGLAQAQQTSSKARVDAFAKLPDWSGLWEPALFVGEGIGQGLSAEGRRAGAAVMGAKIPFNAEWQAKLDAATKAYADAVAADPDHPPAPPYNNCG